MCQIVLIPACRLSGTEKRVDGNGRGNSHELCLETSTLHSQMAGGGSPSLVWVADCRPTGRPPVLYLPSHVHGGTRNIAYHIALTDRDRKILPIRSAHAFALFALFC